MNGLVLMMNLFRICLLACLGGVGTGVLDVSLRPTHALFSLFSFPSTRQTSLLNTLSVVLSKRWFFFPFFRYSTVLEWKTSWNRLSSPGLVPFRLFFLILFFSYFFFFSVRSGLEFFPRPVSTSARHASLSSSPDTTPPPPTLCYPLEADLTTTHLETA